MLPFGLNVRLPTAFVSMGSTHHPSNLSPPGSRVNEKSSPPPPSPSRSETRGASLGTVGRVNSWGRGLRRGSSGGSNSFRKKTSRGNTMKKASSWAFRDDLHETASTFSPSESDFSFAPSAAFFSRRSTHSRRSSSLLLRRASSSPSSIGRGAEPCPELSPRPSSPPDLFREPVPEEPSSCCESSRSSHSSTLGLLEPPPNPQPLPPSMPSLSPSPLVSDEPLTYELTRNKREALGFMTFRFVVVQDAREDDDGDAPSSPPPSSEGAMAQALELSRATLKPVLRYTLLTGTSGGCRPEVPANGWDRERFGSSACSSPWLHPLLVEAAESLFVAVLVDGGSGATQPAVEFLDGAGTPLIPLLSPSEARCRGSVARAMVRALEAAGHRPVPRYLQVVSEEESGRIETAAFGVAEDRDDDNSDDDPARGEAEFPALSGVISTRSGTVDGRPAVEVSYDGQRLSFGCLVHFALKRKAGRVVYYRTNDERVAAQVEIERLRETASTKQYSGTIQLDCDPKPALRRTPLRFVPLTAAQASRANRFAHLGRLDEAVHLLSPRQGLILMKTMHKTTQKNLHDVIDVPILPAWVSVCEKRDPRSTAEELGLNGGDDPSSDEFEHPPSYYEYNNYSSARLPPGYPWRGF